MNMATRKNRARQLISRNDPAVQVVFIGVLAIPLYVPALVGAAIGKLIGREFRRLED